MSESIAELSYLPPEKGPTRGQVDLRNALYGVRQVSDGIFDTDMFDTVTQMEGYFYTTNSHYLAYTFL